MIPSHIRILHVEQEVVGDDTQALQSVLQCDEKREGLLNREKELNAIIAASTGRYNNQQPPSNNLAEDTDKFTDFIHTCTHSNTRTLACLCLPPKKRATHQ
jgi:hypothetical protein